MVRGREVNKREERSKIRGGRSGARTESNLVIRVPIAVPGSERELVT